MGAEKRQHPRRAVLLECRIDGTSAAAATRVSDLSADGCYVESRTPVSPGAHITIRVTFGGAQISLAGRVAHTQTSIGFGMKFDPLSTEIIQAFLQPAGKEMASSTVRA